MSVSQETEKALALAKRALDRCNELENENQAFQKELRELSSENQELRQRIQDLEERDAIADSLIDASRLKVEERAAVCIQTLANDALKQKRRGRPPKAKMDHNEADAALGGELDRRQLLDALERAGDIVDSEVVEFVRENRAAKKNSRLILNLEAGALPSTVAGYDMPPQTA